MAMDTEIIFFFKFERTTQIFVLVIYANSANMLVALCSYALIYYIIQ